MLGSVLRSTASVGSTCLRAFSTSGASNMRVAVLGAGGGIGQPLALLLKHSPMITELACYDVASFTPGVAKDLSHIETKTQVSAYTGPEELDECLKGSSLVLVPAGMPRKPGMTRDDLFNTNAEIAMNLADACARNCPEAIVGIITNPVNSTVPIANEVYKKHGLDHSRKLFGITTLDAVRANTFVAELKGLDILKTNVPVVGGHSGVTILPLLSQIVPATTLTHKEVESLTRRIQDAGTEVVVAKAGAGSATLSMAFAGARFAFAVLRALNGEKGEVECTYVASRITSASYFASPILLGTNGVERNLGYAQLSDFEEWVLENEVLPELKANIAKGVEFVEKNYITAN